MKKLIAMLILLTPLMSPAKALKYICAVDSAERFSGEDSKFAIVYANDYEMVYPVKSWCMSHLNSITCEFEYDGYNYTLEVDIDRAYSPVYNPAGKVTKKSFLRSSKSTVSCYLRE